ncbi:2-octaprenyl-6-methoxyphenyl hydroxylase [Pseudooceanicola sediminis]|uniref:2-octaprenyl-6-methoxyphenyl hydroxylase n=1 Tax=Pseudooceanicola sediminis TaxID=2211117 RepID=A0A399J6C3_9RHOB|nr:UbiH/UbiF/VisC/COQ6 family ubiquinone biosynthesis hydroxylase [Pseudooceanicola sediminis]KAA2313383.1 UbiH/UbiF/VisC/COQ6 family ubiquinone biosynthesis hydroxylase [Puniceibacterium sp. HSS470]RII38336.1 2-octaprenyl-6-methoxyphenyl hydroxylase [Pseudooceanicola sediminis]
MDNPARPLILRGMEHDSDLLIVGGGLNGPALALAAARAGLSATVIDALPLSDRSQSDFDGRSYSLALASVRLLRALGVWDAVADHAQPMLDIKVSDGHAGQGGAPFFLHFDHAEIEEGPMGHMVEDRHLRRALLDAVADTPLITQISGEAVTAQEITAQFAQVTLASGRALKGRVLIGSDGRNSGTAARAHIQRRGWGYGQTALVCAIAHDKLHHGVAHQFFMPAGPLAILPLKGNLSSIVWSETSANAATIQALTDDEYLEALRPRFGDFLGGISLAGKRFTYPLGLSVCARFSGLRLALVGDAAHGMHPIAGQGLNAGLRDVAALAQVLSEAQMRGEDIGALDVLDRYQEWRRFDTATLAMATDLTNRLFSNDNPLLRLGRDLGLGAVGALPKLRRGFIREAAGLTGDLPELMR